VDFRFYTILSNFYFYSPKGIGLFHEFLQNADDAGASEFVLVLDCINHGKDDLLGPNLAKWQG